jgi:HPt (histidine-containing phosphotransfer) domain-containing protein
LGRAAHSIKGSAAYVAAHQLAELAKRIEKLADDRSPPARIKPLITEALHEFDRLKRRLESEFLTEEKT